MINVVMLIIHLSTASFSHGDCGADNVQHSKELLSCSRSGSVSPPSHGVSTKKMCPPPPFPAVQLSPSAGD